MERKEALTATTSSSIHSIKILQNQPKYSHFRLSRLFTKSTHMLFNKNSLKRKEVDLQAIKNEVKIDFYLEYKLCIIIHKKV